MHSLRPVFTSSTISVVVVALTSVLLSPALSFSSTNRELNMLNGSCRYQMSNIVIKRLGTEPVVVEAEPTLSNMSLRTANTSWSISFSSHLVSPAKIICRSVQVNKLNLQLGVGLLHPLRTHPTSSDYCWFIVDLIHHVSQVTQWVKQGDILHSGFLPHRSKCSLLFLKSSSQVLKSSSPQICTSWVPS